MSCLTLREALACRSGALRTIQINLAGTFHSGRVVVSGAVLHARTRRTHARCRLVVLVEEKKSDTKSRALVVCPGWEKKSSLELEGEKDERGCEACSGRPTSSPLARRHGSLRCLPRTRGNLRRLDLYSPRERVDPPARRLRRETWHAFFFCFFSIILFPLPRP